MTLQKTDEICWVCPCDEDRPFLLELRGEEEEGRLLKLTKIFLLTFKNCSDIKTLQKREAEFREWRQQVI